MYIIKTIYIGGIRLKKMIFGGLLFFGGLNGVIALMFASVFNPWEYNGIDGLIGFLLGTRNMFIFILFCVMNLIGTAICVYEAYIQK